MTHRYPIEPLLELTGWDHKVAGTILGISGRTRRKLFVEGLTEKQADRYAVRAGYHPYEVWLDYADHALDDALDTLLEVLLAEAGQT